MSLICGKDPYRKAHLTSSFTQSAGTESLTSCNIFCFFGPIYFPWRILGNDSPWGLSLQVNDFLWNIPIFVTLHIIAHGRKKSTNERC